jgi:serine/threonine-protein kinase RsbW/stage II sporulation protein AB (anti-sigma F factor)
LGVTTRSWTATARPEAVGSLRQEAAAFLVAEGMARSVIDDVRLAISEALANAVVHAYRDAPEPGPLHLAIVVDVAAGHADVVVSDDGQGLEPRDDSPGLGLGMPLIEALAQAVLYRPSPSGGSLVEMRFPFGR